MKTTPHERLLRQLYTRGATVKDLSPCQFCLSHAYMETDGKTPLPVCMNPPCIYARAAAKVAAPRLSLVG